MRITFLLCSTTVNHVLKRLCKTAGWSSSLSSAFSKMCRWGHNWSHKCLSSSAFLSNLCFLFVWERKRQALNEHSLQANRNTKVLMSECVLISSSVKVGFFFQVYSTCKADTSNTLLSGKSLDQQLYANVCAPIEFLILQRCKHSLVSM